MKAYDVYRARRYDEVKIDTVFWVDNSSAEEVRHSLINHDGYPSDIVVMRYKNRQYVEEAR